MPHPGAGTVTEHQCEPRLGREIDERGDLDSGNVDIECDFDGQQLVQSGYGKVKSMKLDDSVINRSNEESIGQVINRRWSRRSVLRGALSSAALSLAGCTLPRARSEAREREPTPAADFIELSHGVDATHHVAPGYNAEILIRWGDPVLADTPPFEPHRQTAAAQTRQFGCNNDYLGYLPLHAGGEASSHGLLFVNHEFTYRPLMFPDIKWDKTLPLLGASAQEQVEIEMAAHGCSVIEGQRTAGHWNVVQNSRWARRITAGDTRMRLSGPAGGHPRLRTNADPQGTHVIGTVNNCAGGRTPWGTFLTAEENFHGYFLGQLDTDHPEQQNYARYGIPANWFAWGRYYDRWHVNKEPQEANRFGWVVEVDPLDPESTPIKRTALGRFKHEGAESVVSADGRLVIYMGDDEAFEYLYRFVSRDVVEPNNRAANADLLDHGTLSVARFHADGSLEWLPLLFGQGGLTPANGFDGQADVLIETRRAADLLGATPLDRPEDVDPHPQTGRVYVMLTNNPRRRDTDAANRRTSNRWGQILELTAPDGDHAATHFQWEVLVQCGDPNEQAIAARWNPAITASGWFAMPDNCAVDPIGRLWISTDQGPFWAELTGSADGLWLLHTAGDRRGTGRMFFRGPVGCEICGPVFTPDCRTLFLSVQHPGSDGPRSYKGFGRESTFNDPATRWPDFDAATPPRPAVVVVTKSDGGII